METETSSAFCVPKIIWYIKNSENDLKHSKQLNNLLNLFISVCWIRNYLFRNRILIQLRISLVLDQDPDPDPDPDPEPDPTYIQ